MTYVQQVIALLTRILTIFAFIAAGLCVVLPTAVVMAATPTHGEGMPCSCCDDQQAIGGGIACPGCQVSVPTQGASPARLLTLTAAWSMGVTPEAAGIDLVPAEPPPR